MIKLMARLTLVALVATAAIYGCSDNSQSPSPTAPLTQLSSKALLEVPVCGEITFLDELSSALPVWQDSLAAWLPDATLNDPPAWDGGSVADYLGQLVPVLQQWQAAVNGQLETDPLGAIDTFDPETNTTQAYLAYLSGILSAWKTAAETLREVEFLPTPPVFAADEFAPVMECPSDTTFSCADTAGVVLDFDVPATDDCDPAPVVVCDPPSGSTFRPGTTTVTCTATDASGNQSTCSFDVVVEADEAAPMIDCPADTVLKCAMPDGMVFNYDVVATDNCDEAPVVTSDPASGSVFPVGTTTVNVTATDAAGNESTCSFDVTVEAAEVTITSATAHPSMLWAPNHKMRDISFDVQSENECGLDLTCTVLEVTSNEPINGLGDGNTSSDWLIGADGSLKLRAERSGTGTDRVYTIRLRCENPESGIGDETTVEVVVPHDMGGMGSGD